MQAKRFFLISGVSGSGKSTVVSVLEDLGFCCIDNLPVQMMPDFISYTKGRQGIGIANRSGYAILLDWESVTHSGFPVISDDLAVVKSMGFDPFVLFLDCQDEVVLRRYQETRRPHPLIVSDSAISTISEALKLERERLSSFREAADLVMDTSGFSPHDLRRAIENLLGSSHTFYLEVSSFGFKYGLPRNVDLVMDVRFLPNPHFVPELRFLTGEDSRVREFVFNSNDADLLVKHYLRLLVFLLPRYKEEGKHYLFIAFGCTGGRHRSVAIANKIGEELAALGYKVAVNHRDKDRD